MIAELEAETLCEALIASLSAWPALGAALQSGGLEMKAASVVESAMQTLTSRNSRVVLREYNHADFVLIEPTHIATAKLNIDTVIEVKFNYARQLVEIAARLPNAINQANAYRSAMRAKCAYVLYFVAAPSLGAIPGDPRDTGWIYWNYPLNNAVDEVNRAAERAHAEIAGRATCERPYPLYCVLLKCPIAPAE